MIANSTIMQTDIINISIPAPCHEAWNKMTPSGDGRFCGNCAKTVTDFSRMSTAQIISYFNHSEKTCGRFTEQHLMQLNTNIAISQSIKVNMWKRFALAVSVLAMSQSVAKGQNLTERAKMEQVPNDSEVNGKNIVQPDTMARRTVTGRVIDDVAKFPLPGATIWLNGKAVTATGPDGKFSLQIPETTAILYIKSLGYAESTVVMKTGDHKKDIVVALKEGGGMLMGDVVIRQVPASKTKRLFNKLIVRPIKKIFG